MTEELEKHEAPAPGTWEDKAQRWMGSKLAGEPARFMDEALPVLYEHCDPGMKLLLNGLDLAGKVTGRMIHYAGEGLKAIGFGDVAAGNTAFVGSLLANPTNVVMKGKTLATNTVSRIIKALDLPAPRVERGLKIGEKASLPGHALRAEAIPAGSGLEYLGPGRVRFDGVEFRAVRDLGHLSEGELLLMERKGIAARDIHGEILEGHHHQQVYHRDPGAYLVEIPESKHSMSNKNQHPNGISSGLGADTPERHDWKKLRKEYWKERAKSELARRAQSEK